MEKFDLNGRQFTALFNSSHGQVNQETIFSYFQDGETIWAIYRGGEVVVGTISGHFTSPDELFFHYGHWDDLGIYRSGTCRSKIVKQDDGRIRIHEKWVWDDESHEGESTLVEVV